MFKRNLPNWERWARALGGLAMLAAGLSGYCPACALAGRMPNQS